jgi:hypothetical protein
MESYRPFLSGLIGAIVMGLLMAWVARASNEKLEPGTIRYSTRMRVVAVLMLVIGAFIAYAAAHASANQGLLAFIIGSAALGSGLWFVLETFFVYARVTPGPLEHFSPWRGRRSIPWSAINGYEFSQSNSMHVLATTTYGKVRFSTMLLGVDQVVEKLGEQPSNDA